MKDEITEGAKVSAISAVGFFTSLTLTDVSVIVSILVGLMTLLYIGSKTYFLFKNNGKGGEG